jgi:hypothetical protein
MTPLRLVLAGAAGSAAADFGDQGHLAYRRTIYRRTDRLTDGGSRIRTTGPSRQECCFFAPTRGAEANRMVAEASISFDGDQQFESRSLHQRAV